MHITHAYLANMYLFYNTDTYLWLHAYKHSPIYTYIHTRMHIYMFILSPNTH